MRRKRRTRNKRLLNLPTPDIDAWLADNPNYMVDCPNQPGNLKISSASCAKRYQTANEPRWANIGAEPYPIFVIKMNLIPCRNCEVGAQRANQVQAA
jgi:hypothetical protein